MVETYNQNSNPNMLRPVVKEEIVDFMRQRLQPVSGGLKELEDFARAENVPVIPHETVAYFRLLLESLQPEKILEIGTAIGFSALLMAEHAPLAQITTIDRNPEMIEFAKANFAKYDSRQQITLLEGDAVDLLETLEDSYDFVFMDSAKSKYVVFLPQVLKRLNPGGLILIDDVFQGGDVAKPFEEIKRGQRAIYRGLHSLFDATLDSPDLTASLLPLGDGLLMIRKK
ncbi:O-methyltransferase [Streptococcus cristatus]|uniref:O-methyltransferase n=1 Tax=Streptococcus cristatus TaxID=45634 RepID=UPI0005ED551F|nr:O-methyltransferase [Streptococcus cristatus]KJQ60149.1 O-methyltransferase [Streptococcus cristatus]QIP49729.1 O-methyltransferase [Streptococcus cristatus ATCC 51100]